MVKYRLNRHPQNIEQDFEEAETQESLYYSEDDYQDYYEENYSDFDEEEIANEKRSAGGVVARSKNYYKSQVNHLKGIYKDNVDMQKNYYEDKESRWLYKQQVQRNDDFIKKLAVTVLVLALVVLMMYLLSRK